jgi:myo-inositol-1(or 4)-monophosphatase
MVLVREAGGFVSDFEGGDDILGTGNIVAGNDYIHRELVAVLKPVGN